MPEWGTPHSVRTYPGSSSQELINIGPSGSQDEPKWSEKIVETGLGQGPALLGQADSVGANGLAYPMGFLLQFLLHTGRSGVQLPLAAIFCSVQRF